jgi:hypothetical protein
MKRIISLCILLLLTGPMAMRAKGQDTMISADKLPENSRKFLNTHFNEMEISYVEVEKELLWVEGYEVILIDGTEVYFTRNGEWKEVERRKNAVPPAIIPREISRYVEKNFPGKEILAIEKENRKWEIKLNNRMELSFDMKWRLIDLDAD